MAHNLCQQKYASISYIHFYNIDCLLAEIQEKILILLAGPNSNEECPIKPGSCLREAVRTPLQWSYEFLAFLFLI